MWYRSCTKMTIIAMPAWSELTTHSLRDSIHCIFTSKLIFSSAEFKSSSSVHAQITTHWEKGPHGLWETADASRAGTPGTQGGPCSLAERGKVKVKQAFTHPAVVGQGRWWHGLAAGKGVNLVPIQPPLRHSAVTAQDHRPHVVSPIFEFQY